jgi:TMEM175 potassium channel family protein
MTDPAESPTPRRWDTARVEAFSDGVFAIAITLLILEISIDPADYDHLARSLVDEWPAYLAYATSFLTVGSVWLAHHDLFTRLRSIDATLMRINLLLLMVAAFLPFPTAVLAQAFQSSNEAERTAIFLYGATAFVMEVLLRGAVRYAVAQPDLLAEERPDAPEAASPPARGWRELVGAALYVVAVLVGVLFFPKVAAIGYLAVAVRGVLVIEGQGRLGLRWLTAR